MAGSTINDFDASKNYRKLQIQKRQHVYAKDVNHVQDILEHLAAEGLAQAGGWKLTPFDPEFVTHTTNSVQDWPVSHIRPNGVQDNGVYTFEAVDATHMKYKYNDDAYSGSFGVTADGSTWNINPGNCGFDFILSPEMSAGDAVSYVANKAIRSSGGDIEGGTDEVVVEGGMWLIDGAPVLLAGETKSGISDGDLVCLKESEGTVNYSSDSDLEHRLADGNLHPKAPIAQQMSYSYHIYDISTLPDDSASEHVYVLGVCSVDGTDVTVEPVYSRPISLALLYEARIREGNKYPTAPSALALDSIVEKADSTDCINSMEARCGLQVVVGDPDSWGCIPDHSKQTEGWFYIHVEATDTGDAVETIVPSILGVLKTPTVIPSLPTCREVQVSVRCINALGLVSSPVTSTAYTIGGSCDITELPSVTLEKTYEGVLATLEVSSDQTDKLQGVSVFAASTAYAPPGYELFSPQDYKLSGKAGQTDTILIPTDLDHPYFTFEFFDYKGVYHGSNVQDNIDLTVSEIDRGGAAPGITFDLEREDSYYGFIIKNLSVDADAETLLVSVCPDGTCPITGEPWIVEVPADVKYIRVPWDMNDTSPLVKVYGVDEFGVVQTNNTTETIDMSDCLISDGDSAPSYTASIGDGGEFVRLRGISSIPSYGKGICVQLVLGFEVNEYNTGWSYFSKEMLDASSNEVWLPIPRCNTIEVRVKAYDYNGKLQNQVTISTLSDTFTMGTNVYVLDKNTNQSNTIGDMLDMIHSDSPDHATLLIKEGEYSEDINLPSGFDTPLVIQGQGQVVIDGDITLDNAPTTSGGEWEAFESADSAWTLQFRDLTVHGRIYRTQTISGSSVSWDVLFDHCTVDSDDVSKGPLKVGHMITDSDYFNILFRNCKLGGPTTSATTLSFQDGGGGNCDINFGFEQCVVYTGASTTGNLFRYTGGRSATIGPAYFLRCVLNGDLDGSGTLYLLDGTLDSLFLAHNTIYIGDGTGVYDSGAGTMRVQTGTDLSGSATDTNTISGYSLLSEAQ